MYRLLFVEHLLVFQHVLVTNREYRLKGPYVILSFLLPLFAYYVVLLLTVY